MRARNKAHEAVFLPQARLGKIHLEGHGDLVSRSIIRMSRVIIWVLGALNLLTKSTDPPSRVWHLEGRKENEHGRG